MLLRRLLLVAIALACTIPLVRGALASALVTRGDALLFAGDGRAQQKYRLALTLDPSDDEAADRYVFAAFLSHDRRRILAAVAIADAALRAHPADAALLADRGLCLHVLRRYAPAARDFARAGSISGDRLDLALAAAETRLLARRAQ
jgi:tetratricopeptide (TPR) repeat protein